MSDQIIEYARKNAILHQYPYLENGLQPVEDYIIDGHKYPGLRSKFQEHLLHVREVWALAEQGKKTRWHVIRQAATVYYYACQLEEQGVSAWPEGRSVIKRYGIREREGIAAAEAIYAWRSEAKDNKDEDFEISLVQAACEQLPRAGRPPKYDSPMARVEFQLPLSLRMALQRFLQERNRAIRKGEDGTKKEMSFNELVIELLRDHEEVQRFLSSPNTSS